VEARAELLPVLRSSRDVLYLDLALEGGFQCQWTVFLMLCLLKTLKSGQMCCTSTSRWRVSCNSSAWLICLFASWLAC